MIQDQEYKIVYLICMLCKGGLQFCTTKKQTTRMFEQELKYFDSLKQ